MKKFLPFFICFAILLSGSFSSTVFAATVYEAESNDSISSADRISPGDTAYGKISSSTDVDYFKFQVSQRASTDIILSNIPSGCDYDISLYDSNGTHLGSSAASGNSDEKISQIMYGTYYIKVKGFKGFSDSSYKLSVSAPSPTTPPTTPTGPTHGGDAYEYNDSRELASNLGSGNQSIVANIHPLGDLDYFSFSVDKATTEHMTINREYSFIDGPNYHFSIYGADGRYISSDGGAGDCILTLEPGSYYLKIYCYNDESVLNYRFVMTALN